MGSRILNLGCGHRTSDHPGVINIDWSMYLRIKRNPWLKRIAGLILSPDRKQRFLALPDNVLVHDMRKPLPFGSEADAVYHSHLLEHLDRPVALAFLKENHRVLKPGGVLRIVVPDLHLAVEKYLASYRACVAGADSSQHDATVAAIIEQCVRREAFASSQQTWWRRRLENLVLGDARARGETHQWMYDEINLGEMLRAAGFSSVRRAAYDDSAIPGWSATRLDLNAQGTACRPGSLYMEAVK